MIVNNISTSMVYIFDLQGNDYTFISMVDIFVVVKKSFLEMHLLTSFEIKWISFISNI